MIQRFETINVYAANDLEQIRVVAYSFKVFFIFEFGFRAEGPSKENTTQQRYARLC